MNKTDILINDVYDRLNCSDYIKDHCKTVYERSKDISRLYDDADLDLIKAGCMLHDIGRTETDGIEHAYIGADLLRKLNIDERICLITQKHIGAGIPPQEAEMLGLPPRDYMPSTLEEKIVAHADNLVHGVKKVDINFVIDKWKNKNMNQDSIDRLIKLHIELVGEDFE